MDDFSGNPDILCRERSRPFSTNKLSFTIVSAETSFMVSTASDKITLLFLDADIKAFIIPEGTNS
jgi:hypothetical protein